MEEAIPGDCASPLQEGQNSAIRVTPERERIIKRAAKELENESLSQTRNRNISPTNARSLLYTLKTVEVQAAGAIYTSGELHYELGGYLGGGIAGVVYEALCLKTKQHVAIKILNPVGYKLIPPSLLCRCIVLIRGIEVENDVAVGRAKMREEHVWWLVHPVSRQIIAAYEDPQSQRLQEIPLPRCIEIWGLDLVSNEDCEFKEVSAHGVTFRIPPVPLKFVNFATNRNSIFREIAHMSQLGVHVNIVRLEEALELVEDSKCTIFLVLELAAGGELFDRIELDKGTDEETARVYFRQLLSGVASCHKAGICHRDLKPENLLLVDHDGEVILKIADFGLSAIFSNANNVNEHSIRRLRSVVGSPHYVAPEVLQDAGHGYDGAKVDTWSIGIILYALLAGNLPFGEDLLRCSRFDRFRKWCLNVARSNDSPSDDNNFPNWLFPPCFSAEVQSLLTQLLNPDPSLRLSVYDAEYHPWVLSRNGNISKEELPTSSAPHIGIPLGMSRHIKQIEERWGYGIAGNSVIEDESMSPLLFDECAKAVLESDEVSPDRVPLQRLSGENIENRDKKSSQEHITQSIPIPGSSPTIIYNNLFNSPPLASSLEKLSEFSTLSLADDLWEAPSLCKRQMRRMTSWNGDPKGLPLQESAPPSYHELVKRSTRFTTCVPAVIVLRQIENIVSEKTSPLPYYPLSSVEKTVRIDWSTYQLDVICGSSVSCTVHVYLVRTGLYLVEFCRGKFDIFQFKRFYEDMRVKLSACLRDDDSLHLLGCSGLSPPVYK